MRRIVLSFVFALAATVVLGGPASADCGDAGRPACTLLRPEPAPSRVTTDPGNGEKCVLMVGGLASPTDGSDEIFFATVLGDLVWNVDRRHIRFGLDVGEYDTEGAISRSSAELGRAIRAISPGCASIHVLAHSMGGLVVDRALSKIDPNAHGVATYVAMASPHNGATAARALRAAVALDPIVADAAAVLGAPDLRSDAVRDLAAARPPRRLPRVDQHVRLRMTTDEIVYRADNFDRRVDVREFAPDPLSPREWLGHGGIVHNEDVQRIVRETIASGCVPPIGRNGSW